MRLVEELDYEHEAAAQRRFAIAYADDADVVIPQVIMATPGARHRMAGGNTNRARGAACAGRRTRSCRSALTNGSYSGDQRAPACCTAIRIPATPMTSDGRLGVLDFGSTLETPRRHAVDVLRSTVSVLMRGDESEILRGLRDEGFLAPGRVVDAGKLADYLAPFTEPARHEVFHFTRDWLRSEFGRVNDPRNPDLRRRPAADDPTRAPVHAPGLARLYRRALPAERDRADRTQLRRYLPGFGAGRHREG